MEPPYYTSRGQQIEALNAQKTKIAKDLEKLVFERPLQRTHKTGILQLPKEVIKILLEQFKEKLLFNFRDWIKPLLKLEEIDIIKNLCANTNVIAIEILKDICKTNPSVIELLDWKELSKNPIAIEILKLEENRKHIEWYELAGNSAAYDLLLEEKETNPVNFHWGNFSANSKGYSLIADKALKEAPMDVDEYEQLLDPQKLDWAKVSSNRSSKVLNYLKEKHLGKINYGRLSGNPNPIAIEMLRVKIKEEKRLTRRELNARNYKDKIDWFLLSGNYAAINLLKENRDKIRYDYLGANEKAISLIRERIIIEKKLRENAENARQKKVENLIKKGKTPTDADALVPRTKHFLYGNNILNWVLINTNRKAINILKENQDKIHLDYLLKNPSIFESDRGNKQLFNSKTSPIKWNTSS